MVSVESADGFREAQQHKLMETLPPTETTITVQELLLRQSALSSHHHVPSLQRVAEDLDRPSPFDRLKQSRCAAQAEQNTESVLCSKRRCLSSLQPENRTADVVSRGRKHHHELGVPFFESRFQTGFLHLSDRPCLLLGWIQLWNDGPDEANCLAFSDFSGTVCCAVTEFDPQFLGRPVRLLSWSYIPQSERGGCLEVRQFSPIEISKDLPHRSVFVWPEAASVPNLMIDTPPSQKSIKPVRHTITGSIKFISPPFSLPQGERRSKHVSRVTNLTTTTGRSIPLTTKRVQMCMQRAETCKLSCSTEERSLLGFFVGISSCRPKPSCAVPSIECCDEVESDVTSGDHEPFRQPVFYIYFPGSIVAWRPLLLAISGKCAIFTRLRKKVLVAKDAGVKYGIYAATGISTVMLCRSLHMEKLKMNSRHDILQEKASILSRDLNQPVFCQKHQVASYVGVVTDIFLRGGLLELDGCVWLLLTHQPLSRIQGLRVGATVRALHVHVLRVKSFLETSLLLAACSVSHIVIAQFSPLPTGYSGKPKSGSCLFQFVNSLPFLMSFWSLQVVANFRRKFLKFYTEKELLGSTKNVGIAEKYLRDSLSMDNIQSRNVFGEFFSHNISCSLAKSRSFNCFLQVPPIRHLCKQIQVMWLDYRSAFWNLKDKLINKASKIVDREQKSHNRIRRVVSSDKLGWTIIGFLQFSSSLGKLQLLDGTGAIDVIIPDLQTSVTPDGAWQVTAYKLVMEGFLEAPVDLNLDMRHLPLSYYSLFKGTLCSFDAFKKLSFFLIFSIKEAHVISYLSRRNFSQCSTTEFGMQHPLMSKNSKEDKDTFDILLVIHKHPLKSKAFDPETGGGSPTFCVEAVRIPYRICIFHGHRESLDSEEAVGILHSCPCTVSLLSLSDLCDISHRKPDFKCGKRGYNCYSCLMTKSSLPSEFKVEKIYYKFTDRHLPSFQVIHIGQLYLVRSLQDPVTNIMQMGRQCWSLVVLHDWARSAGVDEVMLEKDASLPLVDAVLNLPLRIQSEFDSRLKDAKEILSPILSIKEAVNGMRPLTLQKKTFDTGILRGSLFSVYGIIGSFELETASPGYSLCHSFGENRKDFRAFLVKELHCSESIMVTCSSDFQFPVGFGWGAVVVIHRVLMQLSAEGKVNMKCIPSTLIEVCCAGEDSYSMKSNCLLDSNLDQEEWKHSTKERTTIRSILLSNFVDSSVPKLFKIRCRVVAVDRLLLERKKAGSTWVTSCESAMFYVKFVCLTLDDGTGLARCSAQGEVAATLLNIPGQNSEKNLGTTQDVHLIKTMNAVLKKYKRVLYCSTDSQQDPSSYSFTAHGAGGQALGHSEKRFMHASIVKACHASPLDVTAELQTSKRVCEVERKRKQTETEYAKTFSGLFLVAKNAGIARYETDMKVMCKELENSLIKGVS